MKMKKINVCSVGQIWPSKYPICPAKDTLQVIIDVRGAIADPFKNIGAIDGTQQVCQDHILATPGFNAWLIDTAQWLHKNYVGIFELNDDFQYLNIVFMCAGGFQRSVCTAIKVTEHLQRLYPEFNYVVQHWTMEMTREKAESKAQGQD